ncbi:MAG TPA: hypothetical protein VLJ37_10560 [bacterium]|nr:hypothetical protein [bacterium]
MSQIAGVPTPFALTVARFLNHLTPVPQDGTIVFRPLPQSLSSFRDEVELEAPVQLVPATFDDFRRSIDMIFRYTSTDAFAKAHAAATTEIEAVRDAHFADDQRYKTKPLPFADTWLLDTSSFQVRCGLERNHGQADKLINLFNPLIYENVTGQENTYALGFYEGAKSMIFDVSPRGLHWASYTILLRGQERVATVRNVLGLPDASLFELTLEIANRLILEEQFSLEELGKLFFNGYPLEWEADIWKLSKTALHDLEDEEFQNEPECESPDWESGELFAENFSTSLNPFDEPENAERPEPFTITIDAPLLEDMYDAEETYPRMDIRIPCYGALEKKKALSPTLSQIWHNTPEEGLAKITVLDVL